MLGKHIQLKLDGLKNIIAVSFENDYNLRLNSVALKDILQKLNKPVSSKLKLRPSDFIIIIFW